MSMRDTHTFHLHEDELATSWYNVAADLPEPLAPPLGPDGNPATPEMFAPIFAEELVKQEMSTERFIEIPEEVQAVYRTYRATPVIRATGLERALGLPDGVKIFYKYEGAVPTGSHKANSAIPQAFYNKQQGVKRLTTETGAGQWGVALSYACAMYRMECKVYMVRVSYDQKPYRRLLMETYGASVVASPSRDTAFGRSVLERDPNASGGLGTAISEAVEDCLSRDDTHYALGSVLNHVCLHQTIIGQEAIKQMDMAQEEPDVVIACVGGGSNFAGLAFPYYYRRKQGLSKARLVGVEPKACPTLTAGEYRYDIGDEGGYTPMMQMYTLGHDFVPAGIHAGGLRYHGDSQLVSALLHHGEMEAIAVHQNEVFEAAVLFTRNEGIIPAPESAHAIRGAILEALAAKEAGEDKTILFGLSGHGHFDLAAYDQYNRGEMKDYCYVNDAVVS